MSVVKLVSYELFARGNVTLKTSKRAIDAYDTTPYSICDQASDLWQQLELTAEFESDLRDTVD